MGEDGRRQSAGKSRLERRFPAASWEREPPRDSAADPGKEEALIQRYQRRAEEGHPGLPRLMGTTVRSRPPPGATGSRDNTSDAATTQKSAQEQAQLVKQQQAEAEQQILNRYLGKGGGNGPRAGGGAGGNTAGTGDDRLKLG